MNLRKLNPFRKKEISFRDANGNYLSAEQIRQSLQNNRQYFFNSLGANVVWSNFVPNNQNDQLLIEKYNTLSEVSAPIDAYATLSTAVTIDCYTESGSRLKPLKEDDPIKQAIDKFWFENSDKLLQYKKLLANVYINFLRYYSYSSSTDKLELTLLPPQYTRIIPTQTENIDIRNIQAQAYYVYIDNSHLALTIPANEVLHIKESNPLSSGMNYLYGISKLVSCAKNIDSIESGYGAKVMLYKNGPRGIVTGKQIGEFGSANMSALSDETVNDVQDRFNTRYGMQENQWGWVFTNIPLDVTPISMNVQQLQIIENNRSDFEKICAKYGLDPRAISDGAGNTFDNVQAAITKFQTSSFKIEIDNIVKQISNKLRDFYPGVVLKPNYQNIPEIVDAIRRKDKELLDYTKLGLYTRNEFFLMVNERTVSEENFDKYCTFINGNWVDVVPAKLQPGEVSPDILSAQADLRGTASGVESILAIQASVAEGITSLDAGIALLMEAYGYTLEVATRIMGEPKQIQQNEQRTGITEDEIIPPANQE